MKTVVVFGSNSWLAQCFLRSHAHQFSEWISVDRANLPSSSLFSLRQQVPLDQKIPDAHYHSLIHSLKDKPGLVLLFFAWSGTPRTSIGSNSRLIYESNAWLTENYSRIVRDLVPSQVVFISSAGGLYPQDNRNICCTEECQLSPPTPYGRQKLKCEQDLANASSSLDIPIASLRVSSAYGYNKNLRDQGVANAWIHSAIASEPLKIYNSLDSLVNFIGDYQVSSVIGHVISRELSGVFNLGSMHSTSLSALLAELEILLAPDILTLQFVKTETRNFRISSQKLYDNIGFSLPSNILIDLPKMLKTVRG